MFKRFAWKQTIESDLCSWQLRYILNSLAYRAILGDSTVVSETVIVLRFASCNITISESVTCGIITQMLF